MSAATLLSLKQEAVKLSEKERRSLSSFLIKLRQDTPEWKAETSKRLDAMGTGKKTSVSDLRKRLIHEA